MPFALNVAVAVAFAVIVTVHLEEVPAQAPDQPAKEDPAPGEAVRVTVVPELNTVPEGLEATVPLPVPVLEVARVYVMGLKLAAMVWLAAMLLKEYELTAPTETLSIVTLAML